MLENMNQDLQAIEDESLAMAAYYIDRGQNQEAIQLLENLAKSSLQTASKYLMLAGIYQHEGSYELAEEKCQIALKLAEANRDFEAKILAKAGLGQIKNLLGEQDVAQSYFKEASNDFKVLENEVEEKASRLRSAISGNQQLIFSVLRDCSGCNGQSNHRWAGSRCVRCMGG